ncbi:Macrophage erythroblast attacher isoform 1 [Mycena indigotica]|uniref:Macrophage erythroblast attacher isoform 1 n=1 Tax=Mycena indigotica TaxID=2126181 RepID=A0A8H6RX39_9AGAR|nr:Macrophage erythroblast attacher isoform 1 [Mycena indigotica]KAF7288904.1 Macrophage erythroblast attacher isoform 1 [Mycena indigotica]
MQHTPKMTTPPVKPKREPQEARLKRPKEEQQAHIIVSQLSPNPGDVGGTMSTLTFHGPPPSPKPKTRNSAERRASHNAVERQRREALNARFLDLAGMLPSLATIRRPSKSSIVNTSIAHVNASNRHRLLASQQLRGLTEECESLRREVNEWRERAGGIAPIAKPIRGENFELLLSGAEPEMDDLFWQDVEGGVGAIDEEGEHDSPEDMEQQQRRQFAYTAPDPYHHQNHYPPRSAPPLDHPPIESGDGATPGLPPPISIPMNLPLVPPPPEMVYHERRMSLPVPMSMPMAAPVVPSHGHHHGHGMYREDPRWVYANLPAQHTHQGHGQRRHDYDYAAPSPSYEYAPDYDRHHHPPHVEGHPSRRPPPLLLPSRDTSEDSPQTPTPTSSAASGNHRPSSRSG